MTPSKQNWADRAVKALNVIYDARCYAPRDANAHACQVAFDKVKSATDQILYNFRLKRTGSGLQKLFDDLNTSLTQYRKYTSDAERSKVLLEAYKDAFWAWRKLLKERSTAA